MTITIKLDLRVDGMKKEGFPVVIYYANNYKTRNWRLGFYAKKENWDAVLSIPKRNHPNYYELLDVLEVMRDRILMVKKMDLRKSLDMDAVHALLFQKSFTAFFDIAADYLGKKDRSTKWSALSSFNAAYPKIQTDAVTREIVAQWITTLLAAGNKPGGVDSYVRSMRAIWNKISTEPNPFSRHAIEVPEKINVVATENDLKVLQNAVFDAKGDFAGYDQYRDYFLLMFYLGGIDPEVLAKLRYDAHVRDGRIFFNRDKGRSKMACSNIIPDQARAILKKYDCKPFLVPIYKAKDYRTFMGNFNRRLKIMCVNIGITPNLKPKTPRYTFINRAQQLLIDERITGQIVGHKRKTTTSLYTNAFPYSVQDEAHLKVISM